MTNKWLVLSLIIAMYLPVSIDATVLHVAAPTLSIELNASNNELLWIIDIYSLVMACFLLPMGVLGDRIGFKRLALMGSAIFCVASLFAAISINVMSLILSRAFLALGAAMILPATLSALRHTFADEKQRAIALGVWAAVGTGGAAMGPLVGGALMEYYHWGMVFAINVPLCLLVIIATLTLPYQVQIDRSKKLPIVDSIFLIVAILLSIFSIKTGFSEGFNYVKTAMLFSGIFMIVIFFKYQAKTNSPMIDVLLFKNKVIIAGIIMALTAMISLVGFELLISQELQLVFGKTPLQAGLFLLPLMIASSVCGPIAGWLVSFIGLRQVATGGLLLSAVSFIGMAMTDFNSQVYIAWAFMILLGFSVEASLLSSTAAIMNAVPKEKAGAAGAIEGMAYELGAGIGIVAFGLMMSYSYMNALSSTIEPSSIDFEKTKGSLSQAMQYINSLTPMHGEQLFSKAKTAFLASHTLVLSLAALILFLLAGLIYRLLSIKSADIK